MTKFYHETILNLFVIEFYLDLNFETHDEIEIVSFQDLVEILLNKKVSFLSLAREQKKNAQCAFEYECCTMIGLARTDKSVC